MGICRNFVAAALLLGVAGVATAQYRDPDAFIYEMEPESGVVEPPAPGAPPPPRYHQATPEQRQAAAQALALFNSPTLTRFADEAEFRRYLGAVLADQRASHGWFADSGRIRFAQAQTDGAVQTDTTDPICPDGDPACLAASDADSLVLTGSRVAPRNPSITNNQMRNVEEGDIVKQIGRFLLVLQDGRIFVVDTRAGGSRRLALADRIDVYRDPAQDMWYDEMLVFGDRVLITGYSYAEDATELSVFRLDSAGRLSREGVFYVSSDDYYDTSNYATRLIGDNLVIYTPFSVNEMTYAGFEWPVVRRWVSDAERDRVERSGRPLFDAAAIHRPVRDTEDPTVHTVSVCPLGPVGGGRDLECRSTAFIAEDEAQWYVTETDAFLWTTQRDFDTMDSQACDAAPALELIYQPALVYRVPVNGAPVTLVAARGVPPDQFSLHSADGRFRALLKDRPSYCDDEESEEARLAYFDIPLTGFSAMLGEAGSDRYTRLPGVKSHYIANRFTDRYLVYGSLGRSRYGRSEASTPPAYAVPVDRPTAVRPLNIRHTVIRAEQAGNDIVLTGYRDSEGLFVTLVDLARQPRVASSVQLARRYESEGRSHAFNSLIESDGSGVMGLPTIRREGFSSRRPWRSRASDVSFLEVDRQGQLSPVGELVARAPRSDEDDEDGVPGYDCEVSCIDWYGNSRPIFTDGRVFALTGTELVEGRILQGGILEAQRLNIALPGRAQLAGGN